MGKGERVCTAYVYVAGKSFPIARVSITIAIVIDAKQTSLNVVQTVPPLPPNTANSPNKRVKIHSQGKI